ncbi:MAG: DEAD/DEAH box helicase [Nonlabens sp.]
MSFKSLQLLPELISVLHDDGITSPTPVQQEVIPSFMAGRDVLGIAATGSGKTLSYVLPLLNVLNGCKAAPRRPLALVLVPSRELAQQIHAVAVTYSKGLQKPLIVNAVYGGVSINPQMKSQSSTDVLVSTPGRLLDLVEKKAISLSDVKILVLDEADKLLSMGFMEEVDRILDLLPQDRQNALFSATLNDQIKSLQRLAPKDEIKIVIESVEATAPEIKLLGYRVLPEKKGVLLRHLIESQEMSQVLIFCSSAYQVDHVNDKLNTNGIKSKSLHGGKAQGTRTKNLADFKDGNNTGVRCLVTTDVLSRGIDIDFLPYVINYELPRSPKDFIHRIGRTGRAGKMGTAYTLVTRDEAHHMRTIQKKTGLKVWMEDLPEWNS